MEDEKVLNQLEQEIKELDEKIENRNGYDRECSTKKIEIREKLNEVIDTYIIELDKLVTEYEQKIENKKSKINYLKKRKDCSLNSDLKFTVSFLKLLKSRTEEFFEDNIEIHNYVENTFNNIIEDMPESEKEFYTNEDSILNDVIDFVLEINEVSTNNIKDKFGIGYARALRIIDQMERKGIISEFRGSNPREIYVTKDEWEKIKSNK